MREVDERDEILREREKEMEETESMSMEIGYDVRRESEDDIRGGSVGKEIEEDVGSVKSKRLKRERVVESTLELGEWISGSGMRLDVDVKEIEELRKEVGLWDLSGRDGVSDFLGERRGISGVDGQRNQSVLFVTSEVRRSMDCVATIDARALTLRRRCVGWRGGEISVSRPSLGEDIYGFSLRDPSDMRGCWNPNILSGDDGTPGEIAV
ncbi:hypothetical protein Tco_0351940 [Tanacetum coccineum]